MIQSWKKTFFSHSSCRQLFSFETSTVGAMRYIVSCGSCEGPSRKAHNVISSSIIWKNTFVEALQYRVCHFQNHGLHTNLSLFPFGVPFTQTCIFFINWSCVSSFSWDTYYSAWCLDVARVVDLWHLGEQISGYIDYAERMRTDDLEPVFLHKCRFLPKEFDLSYYNWYFGNL